MKSLHIVRDKRPELFHLLNVLPNKQKYLFDPASYGQYLYGTHKKPFSKRFIDREHIVGSFINNKNPLIIKTNNYPIVTLNEKSYELVNLHVHSKKLRKARV